MCVCVCVSLCVTRTLPCVLLDHMYSVCCESLCGLSSLGLCTQREITSYYKECNFDQSQKRIIGISTCTLYKMADLRGKQLPNLKISVDNTESTDESDDEVEVLDDKDVLIHDVAVEHSEQSEDDGETDKDDVEFNVRIGSFSDPKPQKPDSDGNLSEKIKSDIAKDDKRGSSEKRLLQVSWFLILDFLK